MKLEDYTLRIAYHEDWNYWEASLAEFFALKASGSTETEALLELRRLFTERVAYLEAVGKPLPVPGEAPEELFSSTARIDAQAAIARDFFQKVLKLDYDEIFVSDATTLEEFGVIEAIRKRVFSVYGVDIGSTAERPLWVVLSEIRKNSR
jgi:predicted RNase H-like HicB family nuclease